MPWSTGACLRLMKPALWLSERFGGTGFYSLRDHGSRLHWFIVGWAYSSWCHKREGKRGLV